MTRSADDSRFMARALELAARGEGLVEPNPMVGCVIACDGRIIGEGYHQKFGGPHAEIVALQRAGDRAAGATAYLTLEPCCHHGKTPPCTDALLEAGVARVVAALEDPFPQVAGRGVAQLRTAGIEVDVGCRADEAAALVAPYRKLVTTGRPWVIAKWAMTRDGQLALPAGEERWISSAASRDVVQQLRGRVDVILVGSGTARADDPLLTARPANPADVRRITTRVVVDSGATLSTESQLAKTAADAPVLVATAADAPEEACRRLTAAGVEVFRCVGSSHAERLAELLDELGRRRMTNLLVEGGSRVLRTLFDLGAVDEVHVFIAPKLAGTQTAPAPITDVAALRRIAEHEEELDGDVYVRGRIQRN